MEDSKSPNTNVIDPKKMRESGLGKSRASPVVVRMERVEVKRV